jgi:two-component system nitrogen regulation response regulator NtrX
VPSILIIDDEPNLRRMVGALLAGEGYDVREAPGGAEGVRSAEDQEPDAVLLDLMMPGELDGLGALQQLRARFPALPVLMMSGRAGLADAVKAAKLGAVNFLEKPLAPENVLVAVQSALELRLAKREAESLRAEVGLFAELVGDSAPMKRVRADIARVAPTDARVLVTGESGTGKELVASAIHRASPRAARPLVRVNCAAIPRDLVESEMFGHERGAFTGATDRRIGRFELAHTGTLLLDEVGDLGAEAQAKLLRALEAREIERVGGAKPIPVDVRVVSATNKDLLRAVADGQFREDLYFRLNVIPIHIPPLRDRKEDIPALVRHHGALYRRRAGAPAPMWTEEALEAFAGYRWPGNVRELANVVERLAILHAGEAVRGADVREVLAVPAGHQSSRDALALPDIPLSDALDDYERRLIARALDGAAGNIAEAARRLQTDRPNLYRRMKRLGILVHGEA